MVKTYLDPPLSPPKARHSSGRPWESLWEGLEELWESFGRLWAELREALGELWEGLYIQKKTYFFGKTTRRRQDSTGDQDFYKNRRHFSEKQPAGGKIAPETRTFTKKKSHFPETRPAGGRIAPETGLLQNRNVIFQKNDPPEAR